MRQDYALAPNGSVLLVYDWQFADSPQHFSLWNLSEQRMIKDWNFNLRSGPRYVAFSPDGRWFAFESPYNTIQIWRVPAN